MNVLLLLRTVFFYNMGAQVNKTLLLVSRNYLLPSSGCLFLLTTNLTHFL